jgi:hypothetical protein
MAQRISERRFFSGVNASEIASGPSIHRCLNMTLIIFVLSAGIGNSTRFLNPKT